VARGQAVAAAGSNTQYFAFDVAAAVASEKYSNRPWERRKVTIPLAVRSIAWIAVVVVPAFASASKTAAAVDSADLKT